ncbi:DUF6233 domain-containing protein [Streptomyces sp. NPDC054786]
MDVGADPRPVAVQHGECSVSGARHRRITRPDAIEALSAGVESCVPCRPAHELQVDRDGRR